MARGPGGIPPAAAPGDRAAGPRRTADLHTHRDRLITTQSAGAAAEWRNTK